MKNIITPDLPQLNCSRGAPLGRHGVSQPPAVIIPTDMVVLQSLPIPDGYDSGGAYWGLPDNLWRCYVTTNEGEVLSEQFFRASSTAEATDKARELFGDCTFVNGISLQDVYESFWSYCLSSKQAEAEQDEEMDENDRGVEGYEAFNENSKQRIEFIIDRFVQKVKDAPDFISSSGLGEGLYDAMTGNEPVFDCRSWAGYSRFHDYDVVKEAVAELPSIEVAKEGDELILYVAEEWFTQRAFIPKKV